ncbi:MAG: NUDIX domain-containing protein [Prevotella sp.]|nr:NUDIX domain-containing protein [Prevotella sp.]
MKHPLDKFQFCPVCGSSEFYVNNFKSKRCNACGFTYYLNPSAATAAFIVSTSGTETELIEKLLVARRGKEPAKGTLDLPGGFSDMDETSEEGVAREVLEETGLRVTRTEFLFSLPNRYVYSGLEIPTMDMFYRCEVETADGSKNVEQAAHAMDDAAELMWIPINELRPEAFGLNSIRKAVEIFLHRFERK